MPRIIPAKQFQFTIEIDGLDAFIAQDVTTPDLTTEEAEHGEGSQIVRTPALSRIGDITLTNLVPQKGSRFAINWFEQVNNINTGSGQGSDVYLKTVVIRLLDNAGNPIAGYTREYKDCWLKSISGITLSKTSSDNVMEEAAIVTNGYAYT